MIDLIVPEHVTEEILRVLRGVQVIRATGGGRIEEQIKLRIEGEDDSG